MSKTLNTNKIIIGLVILFGIGLRFYVATRGNNFDYDSYVIVADIISSGKNVYANTPRYNYGPIWFNLLYIFNTLSLGNSILFRVILVIFLIAVDFITFIVLFKRLGKNIAILFFLNPVSIIITGYHNQFDNLAILLGILSVSLIEDNFDKSITLSKFTGLCVLGLSIATKHILFAFPLWLAVKQKGLWNKVLIVSIPLFVFFVSFLPYWTEGHQGIIQNVLKYRSFYNQYFYNLFVPLSVQYILTSMRLWILLLGLFAFLFRPNNIFESLLVYLYIFVMTSPSIANQYLVIPLIFAISNINIFTFSYIIFSTICIKRGKPNTLNGVSRTG